jgi:uncharacterized protein YydD (DUF2326 family)
MQRFRIRRLASEPALFDEIEFYDGLNLILGEKWSESDTRGRKVNGVGKTLCVEFIQFGLLKKFSDSRLAKIPEDVLPPAQKIVLELEIGNRPVRITRTVEDESRPIIAVDGRRGRMMDSLEDGLELLSALLFDTADGPIRPTFRELFSLLAREEDSEFKDILAQGDYPANLRPHLYLLGLPLPLYDQLGRVKKSVQSAKELVNRFKQRLTDHGRVTVDAARAELNKAEASVSEIAAALDALEAEPAIAKRQDELIRIESELETLRAQRQAVNYQLEQIAAVPKFERIDERDIELVYESFKNGLGALIAKELRDVISFKERIEEFQGSLLNTRRGELTNQRSALNRRISTLAREYAALVRSLDSSGVLSELKLGVRAAQEHAADYYARREAERNHREAVAEADEGLDEWNDLSSELRKALEALQDSVRSVESTILDIHETIMGDRSASFDIVSVPKLSRREPLEFRLRIVDDGSHSVNRTKVFIYDWALVLNRETSRRHPEFLLHDNLFDVDQDTLVRSLNFVQARGEHDCDFQYILTLNRDKIENEERRKEIQFDVDLYRRARFTKERPFLRRAYQERAKART